MGRIACNMFHNLIDESHKSIIIISCVENEEKDIKERKIAECRNEQQQKIQGPWKTIYNNNNNTNGS